MTLESRLKWFVSIGLIMNMVGFLAPAAVLPQILDDWQLSEKAGGLLTGALFGGYALSSPFLSALTDRIDAKRIMLAALIASACAGYGIAYLADGLWSTVGFRVIAGFGLAGYYMPGLKLIADLLEGDRRMRTAAVYPSMFALGGAGPFFVASILDAPADWRWIFVISGHAALIAFVIVALLVPGSPNNTTGSAHVKFHAAFGRAVRNKGVQAYSLAAVGHISEIFSFRSWIIASMIFGISLPINQSFTEWNLPFVAALSTVITVPASVMFARLSMTGDRRKIVAFIALSSASVAVIMAFSIHGSFLTFCLLLMVYGVTTFGDTATLSGGVVMHADAESRGAALAVFSLCGFGGGMVGPIVIGLLIESFGGRLAPDAWSAAYLGLACFALVPALTMGLYSRWLEKS
ncbi:MAG: MFS transporter [Rhodospirillaceae bacterium]|nr:MFS transporter [Rhodospirillaceae bacterium]